MAAQQLSIPITEVSDLEVLCPGCETSYTLGLEGRRWLPPSCPVCDRAFGPRFTEALQDYLRFLESAKGVEVEVNLCIDTAPSPVEKDRPASSALASGT